MTETTPLDLAHAAMEAAQDDDALRLRFFERLADAELFVLLKSEADGDAIEPELFDVDGSQYVLVFDREARLSAFVGQAAPYAALSGRGVANMLASAQMGLGLNLDVAPSSILIPPAAVLWLHQTLGQAPQEIEARISGYSAPAGLPDVLIKALDAKLATARGLAASAYLVSVSYEDGGQGHLLGFVDALDGAEAALAKATNEALTFSGIEAGAIDVGFFAASDPAAAHMARYGLRFDLPVAATEVLVNRPAPGSDPDKPPLLR
ncbi:hypothetical protein SuNHUV7_22040 (plasmid) [Pseudoseohaeicola sp. NH-UV-7]|uniref:SseB family protein n=1 Tax=Sulfitobacter sp. TBRI5 TaxID=2989732 RepID=UPI003A5DB4EB